MKTILVATDYSDASLNAANYAIEVAKQINASIHILHVYQLPVSYGDLSAAVASGEIEEDALISMKSFQLKLFNKNSAGFTITSEVQLGDFLSELEKTCKKINPYFVVLGLRKSSAFKRFFLGSQAIYALQHLECPLLLVPEHASFRHLKKVGVACDLMQVTETLPVEKVKLLVEDFGAELHVVNAATNTQNNPHTILESDILREILEQIKHEYHFIESEDIDKGITDFAASEAIDILLVMHKKHDFFERLFLTSHTKEIALMSKVPVMVLRK